MAYKNWDDVWKDRVATPRDAYHKARHEALLSAILSDLSLHS
jgi:hypothetical protein